MSQAPIGQPAFVLHSRAYRENSALVDFLTPQGRLRAVLRSARGKAGTLARALRNTARSRPCGVRKSTNALFSR